MGRRRATETHITPDASKITVYIDPKWKLIRLHAPTLKAYFSNYDYAQVFFITDTQRIVIQPVAKETPECVVIDYPSGALMLWKFFAQHKIEYRTGKYLAKWDCEMNYLVIEPGNYPAAVNV